MILCDITLCAPLEYRHAPDFNAEMNCVSNHYLRRIGRFKNDEMRKLIIEAGSKPVHLHQIDVDIWQCGVHIDFKRFWREHVQERKHWGLDCLHRSVGDVAKHFNWDLGAFQAAYQGVLEDGLKNRFFIGKAKSCANRKYRAQVLCDYEHDAIRLFIHVLEGTTTRATQLVQTTQPHEIFIVDLVGTLRWESDTEVALLAKDGTTVGSARVD